MLIILIMLNLLIPCLLIFFKNKLVEQGYPLKELMITLIKGNFTVDTIIIPLHSFYLN